MKKIVPFNNILNFSTSVCEITAISLEHDIKTASDAISGVFYISGEYKITDGQLEKEKFNFELPFDIALGCNYNLDTLVVDIDDFRYELIDKSKLKVNIDLFIDGEVIEPPILITEEDNTIEINQEDRQDINENETSSNIDDHTNVNEEALAEQSHNESIEETTDTVISEPIQIPITKNIDLLDDMLKDKEEVSNIDINIENTNENNNTDTIFNTSNEEEKYVTYRVYRVETTDTIDKILEKYDITKEDLEKYNNIEDIKPGEKLIIPANDK